MHNDYAEEHSFSLPACHPQAEALKRSLPRWSLPKASRDCEKKVFISKKHPQDLLGKDSPGHVYEPKRQKELPYWGFGTAEARPALKGARYPEPINDLTGNIPDNQVFKFPKRDQKIGSCPRDASSNSPDYEGYPMGTVSPGPQRYNPQNAPPAFRMAHAPTVDQVPPKYTMRPKTKIMGSVSQTGENVGPGLYPVPAACEEQASSLKSSLPRWSVCKRDRFTQSVSHGDAGRLWDGMGEKKIEFNRSFSAAPSFSFGTSTRQHAKRMHAMMTKLDLGPSAFMEKPTKDHPSLPPRREILRYTDVPSG